MSRIKFFIVIVAVLTLVISCKPTPKAHSHWGKNWAWMNVEDLPDSVWTVRFGVMKNSGIDGLLILYKYSQDSQFKKVAQMAKDAGFEVHAWFVVLNPHDTKENLVEKHPDWFVVSREGISCIEKPPYIPGYKWLCPSHKQVHNYVVSQVETFARMDFIDGVHLDYIRLPDVILPVGLWSRYNLIQDHELPQFDYCYCDTCLKAFEDISGYDPRELEDPSKDTLWRQFRYDIITNVVNKCYDEAKNYDKKLSAAVFHGPDLAKMMVRQDWIHWKIDALMPMMYHQYYNEPVSWVEKVTREGVEKLNTNVSLYSGVFIGEISPEKMIEAVESVKNGGAKGICLFNAGKMTPAQWTALGTALKEENN